MMPVSEKTRCYWVPQLISDGNKQMAMDEALLAWVREQPEKPMLICRTYVWEQPTLSFGVHQKGDDALRAYRHYSLGNPLEVVTRPTGGRAILHGSDVSFSFVTNDSGLLKLSLNDSYCVFTTWVKTALQQCNIPLKTACTQDEKAYMRSPLCFETYTPSDLATPEGQKVAGSAQLRRHGGILQHGAAFLAPFGITAEQFDTAFRASVAVDFQGRITELLPAETPELQRLWLNLTETYSAASAQMRARLLTTLGSHLLPASD